MTVKEQAVASAESSAQMCLVSFEFNVWGFIRKEGGSRTEINKFGAT